MREDLIKHFLQVHQEIQHGVINNFKNDLIEEWYKWNGHQYTWFAMFSILDYMNFVISFNEML
jgi:hypothetical protein